MTPLSPPFSVLALITTNCPDGYPVHLLARLNSGLRHLIALALMCHAGTIANAQETGSSVPEYPPQAFLPASPDTVVSTLPDAVVSLAAQVRKEEHAAVTLAAGRQPFGSASDLRQILTTYQLAERENSARGYGHTLSLIARWPADKPAPSLLLLIKAAVLQHNHAFAKSRRELDTLLARQPTHRPALEMAAQVSLVMADYDAALHYCAQLGSAGYDIPALNCREQVDGLTGRALPALSAVTERLGLTQLPVTDSLELNITAADIARRLGRGERAQLHYQTALALAPHNRYLLTNYSAWLLEQEKSGRVLTLLEGHEAVANSFELQMILARALQLANRQPHAQREIERLETATSAMALRGADRPHKLIARFQIWFGDNPALALAAAQANWAEQKEPSDARLLAEAALAAKNSQVLVELQQWTYDTGLEDKALTALLAQPGDRS